ncbi:MAG: hypothetical protein AABZ39_10085 [Spirochaetota bacterium]
MIPSDIIASIRRERSVLRPTLFPRGSVEPDTVIIPTKFIWERFIARQADIPTLSLKATEASLFSVNGVSFAGPCFGAPAAAFLLENLVAAGAKRIIIVGTAGGIADAFSAPSLAVIERGVDSTGIGTFYRDTSSPDEGLTHHLSSVLEARGYTQRAVIASMDAPYRETPSLLSYCTAKGASLIDMEIAAMFSVANALQTKAAAFAVVSDVVDASHGVWNTFFKKREFHDIVHETVNMLPAVFSEG